MANVLKPIVMFMTCLDKVMLKSRATGQDDVINYQFLVLIDGILQQGCYLPLICSMKQLYDVAIK